MRPYFLGLTKWSPYLTLQNWKIEIVHGVTFDNCSATYFLGFLTVPFCVSTSVSDIFLSPYSFLTITITISISISISQRHRHHRHRHRHPPPHPHPPPPPHHHHHHHHHHHQHHHHQQHHHHHRERDQKKTNRDQKKQIRIKKKQIGIKKKKTNLKTKGGEGRKEGRKKEVNFSWKMKGTLPSLDPPTRFDFSAGSPCYLLFFFPSIIVVYLGSFNLDWYPSRLVPMYFFLGTHCGGRRCALPPAPPHSLLF